MGRQMVGKGFIRMLEILKFDYFCFFFKFIVLCILFFSRCEFIKVTPLPFSHKHFFRNFGRSLANLRMLLGEP
jgi:hypothetical protein